MGSYMIEVSYTAEAWAAQLKSPQNRIDAIKPMIERNGAKITGAWYAFGDADLVLIVEGGDNITTAASILVAAAGGAVSNIKTTVLMSVEDGIKAIKQAGEVAGTYTPPA
ncbi:MAG: GYD domain-containing protein [Thermomicrobiales bacterium]